MPQVARKQNQYSSGLAMAVKANLAPRAVLRLIPRSTRHSMRQRDFSQFIGLSAVEEFERSIALGRALYDVPPLRRLVRCLLAINRVLRSTLAQAPGRLKLLSLAKVRVAAIVNSFGDVRSKDQLARWFGITRQRLDYWLRHHKHCVLSLADLCRVRHPFQLVPSEVRKIRDWLSREEYRSWPLVCVFLLMRAQGALFCGLSTFYKYARLLGFTRARKRWRKPPKVGIRASAPGELLHADVTHVWLYGGQKVAIFQVIDNFSRKLLASVAMPSGSAERCLAVLVQIVQENSALLQKPFTLLTDAGSENKGAFEQWALEFPDLVRKLIALKHIAFSNSMAEVAHHIMKGDYIRDHAFHTIEALQAFLDRSRADYNGRPCNVHDGLSANAVFAGALPVRGRFKEDTRAARAARVSENSAVDCSACALPVKSV